MNAESSRSHLVLSVIIESTNKTNGQVTRGKVIQYHTISQRIELRKIIVANSTFYSMLTSLTGVSLPITTVAFSKNTLDQCTLIGYANVSTTAGIVNS